MEKAGELDDRAESVILEFARIRPLYISELKNQPPNRVCYKIKHRYPKITGKRAVEFLKMPWRNI